MRLAWAFFKRDAVTALSYRIAFLAQLSGNMIGMGVFYFIAKTVGTQRLPALADQGGNLFAFLLVGIALSDCVGISLSMFALQVREGQFTGTLEATLISPVSLPLMMIYSSLWSYFFCFIRFVIYLSLGAALYNVSLRNANLPVAVLIFFLTVVCFMGLGILWASIVLIIKRGEAVMSALGYVFLLLGGVLFPVSVMPHWLQAIAWFIPLKHALEAMRFALLQGYSFQALLPKLALLSAFAAVLLVAGLITFSATVRAAKHNGTLSQS
jgi:ABC-2 type transport system permease protein